MRLLFATFLILMTQLYAEDEAILRQWVINLDNENYKIRKKANQKLSDTLDTYTYSSLGEFSSRLLTKKNAPQIRYSIRNYIHNRVLYRDVKSFLGISHRAKYIDHHGKKTSAIQVIKVQLDSPAYKAGLRSDDYIISVDAIGLKNYHPITKVKHTDYIIAHFSYLIKRTSPSTIVSLKVYRGGKKSITIKVKLQKHPKNPLLFQEKKNNYILVNEIAEDYKKIYLEYWKLEFLEKT